MYIYYVEVMEVFLGHVYDFSFFFGFFPRSSLVNSFLREILFFYIDDCNDLDEFARYSH